MVKARDIKTDDLRYLLAVARTGRMNTAAAILGVDHTTVSRRITHLESQLGVRLLDRGGDGWQLTELGRQVAEQAVPIEDALDRVLQVSLGEQADTLRGTIRMTTPDGFGTRFAIPALAEVHRRHPHLTVELVTATRQLSLHSAGFDLAIALGAPSSSRLYSETLTPYSLALYAHEDYLANRAPIRRPDDLVDHTVVFYVDSLLQVGDLDISRYLPAVTSRFASTNVFAQLEATRLGVGVGLLPSFLAEGVAGLRKVLWPQIEVQLTFTLAARQESIGLESVGAVRDALRNQVTKRRDELVLSTPGTIS